jgi:fructose transport system ATP-binding protein
VEPHRGEQTPRPILEVQNIRKHFRGVVALSDANFSLLEGEVHAIVGDNGAGKSTLLKIISGVIQPDGGQISVYGRKVIVTNPKAARSHGIMTLFQDLALINHLDVAENLYLGRELLARAPLSWIKILNKKRMRQNAAEELSRLRIGIRSTRQLVMNMSGGQRQAIAVARAVAFGARIVIMDEPTAALGVRESAAVIDLIRRIKDDGVSVILISHNLPEVFEVADRITTLRLGRTIDTKLTGVTSLEDIVAMMTGVSVAAPK